MMMRCLEAGGLEAIYDKGRDSRMNQRLGDGMYKPNADGFMEMSAEDYRAKDFPKAYEGKLIKCLRHGVLKLPAGEYRIVYMRRDGEECRQSAQAIFSAALMPEFAEIVDRETETISGILEQRRDCKVVQVWYRSALENPLDTFTHLVNEGWPIDPVKAAAIVDESKCRFRKESLQAGA